MLPRHAILIAVPAILLIGWIDLETGPDLGLSLLYLVPIVVVAWYASARPAIAAAVLASSCWIAADYFQHTHGTAVTAWNGFTRLIIYAGTAYLVARVKIDREEMHALNAALELALARESELARTDTVSGLANGRAFVEHLRREAARALREGAGLTLLFLDLDDFKSVNDNYGHAGGDEVLRRAGYEVTREVRAGDMVARMGGDEFVVLLWHATPAEALAIADRITRRIGALAFAYPLAHLGVSVGMAHYAVPPDNVELMLRAADDAMYVQKAQRHAARR